MHLSPPGLGYNEASSISPKCEIGRVSNGYFVTIYNSPPPPTFDDFDDGHDMQEDLLKTMVDAGVEINRAAGGAAARGVDEEVDKWKKDDLEVKGEDAKEKAKNAITLSIEKAKMARFKAMQRQRTFRPVETFVFLTIGEVTAFVAEKMAMPKAP